ncbi:MAG: phytanoyl-CoA dioxygenase family protein [Pseudomonadota bacterium]
MTAGRPSVRPVPSDQVSVGELVQEFRVLGFTVIEGVLRLASCQRTRAFVEREIGRGPGQRPFGNIHEPQNRYDTPFAVDGLPREILREACRHPKLAGVLRGLLSDEASLEELSALTSYPGAEPQRLHADTDYRPSDALLISVFVALDDLDETMGPLEAVQQSSRGRGTSERSLATRMTLASGDAVLLDSTTVHRGGANNSADKPRPVFYFSFLDSDGARPQGATYSIIKRPGEVVTLGDFL